MRGLLRLLLSVVVLGLPSWSWGARSFPGGAGTDNILSTSTITPATQRSFSLWMNITAIDANSRRALQWGDSVFTSVPGDIYVITGVIAFEVGWSTTGGGWTVPSPSTGAWHNIVVVYDGGSTANNPVIYIDGVSQTVTRTSAPAGTLQTTAEKIIVGHRADIAVNRQFNGSIAEVAHWDALLTGADATLLASQPPCHAALSAKAVNYWPYDNSQSPEPDLVVGNNGVVTGTSTTGNPSVSNPRCAGGLLLLGVGR